MEPFIRTYDVRIGDINYGAHMGNEVALVVFQDARIAFLDSLGCSEKDIGEGLGLILVEAHVVFRKEVFLNDRLETRVTVSGLRRSAFDLQFDVVCRSDGERVFHGWTRMLPYNYGEKKVRRVPETFRVQLERYAT